MKTCSLVVCLSFFLSLTGMAQTKYGVEFVGGVNYGLLGTDHSGRDPYGITGGVGVIMNPGREVEIVAHTLFTIFPPPHGSGEPLYSLFGPPSYSVYPPDKDAYGLEIAIGPRFNGHGSSFVHPFLIIQGGMQLLRIVEQTDYYYAVNGLQARSTSQFLNIHGTEDVQLRGVINVGGGLRFVPSQSVLINLQATYKFLIGKGNTVDSFVPVTLSVLLPV